MKKSIIIILCIFLIIVLVTASIFTIKCIDKKHGDVETYTVGDGNSLKVGVFSDSQLPKDGNDSRWTYRVEQTLKVLKEKDIDVLIMAGDFTDLSTTKSWASFKKAFDNVFGEDKPILSYVMGNHDYWVPDFFESFDVPIPAAMQNRFIKYTGEYPYTHKIVNGYHFIAWSSSDGSYDKSYSEKDWIKEQLEIAVADDPTKPIFVTTHLAPKDAVYGGDDWGNQDIYDVLKDYPQVVSFSGHSHYSLVDERSILQTAFTAINTQTIDYVELEEGKFNGSIPKDAYNNSIAESTPMSLIMNVNSEKITIQRLDALTGEEVKQPWVLNAPYSDLDEYTLQNEQSRNLQAPVFSADINAKIENKNDKDNKPIKVLSFVSASDDDFVHSYRIEFKDANGNEVNFERTKYDGTVYTDKSGKTQQISELLYFSDFVSGLDKMKAVTELRLPANMPDNVKTLTVYAIDSFGKESNSVNIAVN